jgi:hypothetical protein
MPRKYSACLIGAGPEQLRGNARDLDRQPEQPYNLAYSSPHLLTLR